MAPYASIPADKDEEEVVRISTELVQTDVMVFDGSRIHGCSRSVTSAYFLETFPSTILATSEGCVVT